jgi:hypothetical protein
MLFYSILQSKTMMFIQETTFHICQFQIVNLAFKECFLDIDFVFKISNTKYHIFRFEKVPISKDLKAIGVYTLSSNRMNKF